MIHQMKLHSLPFAMISSGSKTVEMRLYDEKRQKIKVNDIIEFTNTKTKEKIACVVIGLHIYSSFEGLYKLFDKISLGYLEEETADYKDMEMYYSDFDIAMYGVVGIEVAVISELEYQKYKVSTEELLDELKF